MKKIKYLVALFLFESTLLIANPVLVNTAQQVAANFYTEKYHPIAATYTLAYTERDLDNVPVYYVFNVNANKGFIIVTADDAAIPVIGYSEEGSFVTPTINSNIYFWLEQRKKEVIAMRMQHVPATFEITSEWKSFTAGVNHFVTRSLTTGRDSVLPLCKTYWDQYPIYNAMCPGGSVTGCVATAMAQIMRYWEYPATGTGFNCYDDATSQGFSEDYGELCATFDSSDYVWSAMPQLVSRTNDEVAKLMYDCGVSVNMDYSPTGSGAYVMGSYPSAEYSYVNYFGYDASAINTAMYGDYQESDWIALLENELNNGRPMQFEGWDSVYEGHTWVCDGYSATNEMHMNWGWSGYDNGYYAVTNLNPLPYVFVNNVGVLYGIQPPAGALAIKQVSDNSTVSVYPNPSQGIFNFTMSKRNSNYQILIYNVLGQEVTTSVMNYGKGEINLSSQPKGIYLYKVFTEKGELVSAGKLVAE